MFFAAYLIQAVGPDQVSFWQTVFNIGGATAVMGVFTFLIVQSGKLHTDHEFQTLKSSQEAVLAEKQRQLEQAWHEVANRDMIIVQYRASLLSTIPALSKLPKVIEAIPDKENAVINEVRSIQEITKALAERLEHLPMATRNDQ